MIASTAEHTSHLANPLVTANQLASSGSQLDGIPSDLETSIIFAGAQLTQNAGVLLRLPQDAIAQAIVIFTRFWIGSEGGSLREHGAQDVSLASVYLVAKLSAYPKSPRSVINVYAYLNILSSSSADVRDTASSELRACYVSEGEYQAKREGLARTESTILKVLGYQTHVALPYNLCINYLQALDVFANQDAASRLAKRAFAHLTSSLLNPQLLYLTHQPAALATAAIYLSAKEVGVKLPDVEWWEVFDTDREGLGFLVVAMISMEGFVMEEKKKWTARMPPMTLEQVESHLAGTRRPNGGT